MPELRPIRVLIVDDSAYNRRHIGEALAMRPELEVVGKAADGEEALKLALALKPDVITLDLEMPKMDGFTFLRILMVKLPIPTIVFSSYAQRENVLRSLELGALDFVPKPDRVGPESLDVLDQLAQKLLLVRAIRKTFVPSALVSRGGGPASAKAPLSGAPAAQVAPDWVIAFACSTGGPSALLQIWGALSPRSRAAYLVAQHMPEKFTKAFAERLDKKGAIRTREATDGEVPVAGTAIVCPGARCLELEQSSSGLVARVLSPGPDDRFVPSADRLFRSVAALGPRAIGVVLTGMGDDGVRGAEAIRKSGGTVLVESEETAVVAGMPMAVRDRGLASQVLPVHAIAAELARICRA